MIRLEMKDGNTILTDKYEYLTGEEIVPFNQRQIIKQAKFAYSILEKAFQNKQKRLMS